VGDWGVGGGGMARGQERLVENELAADLLSKTSLGSRSSALNRNLAGKILPDRQQFDRGKDSSQKNQKALAKDRLQ
jgi:hypothetical protein